MFVSIHSCQKFKQPQNIFLQIAVSPLPLVIFLTLFKIYGISYVSHCNVERIHYEAISLRNLLFPAILTISPLFPPSALKGESAGQVRIAGRINTAHAENIKVVKTSHCIYIKLNVILCPPYEDRYV